MIIVCRKFYSPIELEEFTLFQSAINFFGVLFIFKFDSLFYIEKIKSIRDQLFYFSIFSLIFFSIIFLGFNFVFNLYSFSFDLILLMTIGILFMGIYTLSQAKLINENQFMQASIARILMPFITFILSIFLVFFSSYKEYALIIGLLGGIIFSVLIQILFLKLQKGSIKKLNFKLLKNYQKDLASTNVLYVINSFRDSLFILFVTIMYEAKDIAASYSQGLRIVSLPSVVLSGAIGSVVGSYLKIDIENKEIFKKNYLKLLVYIILASFIIYIVSYFIMDYLVVLLLTEKWIYVSICAKSLIPLLFMNFILNALNGYFLVLRLQFFNLIINIFDISFFILSLNQLKNKGDLLLLSLIFLSVLFIPSIKINNSFYVGFEEILILIAFIRVIKQKIYFFNLYTTIIVIFIFYISFTIFINGNYGKLREYFECYKILKILILFYFSYNLFKKKHLNVSKFVQF